jgi:phage virion morphogenesis protein
MKIHCLTQTQLTHINALQQNLTLKKTKILQHIGAYMVAETIENFHLGGRPKPWKPLAPSTLKQKKGTLILVESGMLKLGIMHWVQGDAVYIAPSGPAITYSRIHQKGGKTGIARATIIPARPYLLILPQHKTYIRKFNA